MRSLFYIGALSAALSGLSTNCLAEGRVSGVERAPMIIRDGEHGGKRISIEEHHFEIVILNGGVMIYAKDDASESIEATRVRGFVQTSKGPVSLTFERKGKSQFFAPNIQVPTAKFIAIDVLFSDGHGVGGRLPLRKKPVAGLSSAEPV